MNRHRFSCSGNRRTQILNEDGLLKLIGLNHDSGKDDRNNYRALLTYSGLPPSLFRNYLDSLFRLRLIVREEDKIVMTERGRDRYFSENN